MGAGEVLVEDSEVGDLEEVSEEDSDQAVVVLEDSGAEDLEVEVSGEAGDHSLQLSI